MASKLGAMEKINTVKEMVTSTWLRISKSQRELDVKLFDATKQDDVKLLSVLLNAGAKINATNTQKESIVLFACKNNAEHVLFYLLQYGAQINSFDTILLNVAAQEGNVYMFSLLLNAGVKLPARYSDVRKTIKNEKFHLLLESANKGNNNSILMALGEQLK